MIEHPVNKLARKRGLTRISHGQSTVAVESPMATALRLENEFDIIQYEVQSTECGV